MIYVKDEQLWHFLRNRDGCGFVATWRPSGKDWSVTLHSDGADAVIRFAGHSDWMDFGMLLNEEQIDGWFMEESPDHGWSVYFTDYPVALTPQEREEMEALMVEEVLQGEGVVDSDPLTPAELARLDSLIKRSE